MEYLKNLTELRKEHIISLSRDGHSDKDDSSLPYGSYNHSPTPYGNWNENPFAGLHSDVRSNIRSNNINSFYDNVEDSEPVSIISVLINIVIWACYIVAVVCIFGVAFLWIATFSAIMTSAILVGMCIFFVFFVVLWLTDRGLLFAKSIQSRCGNCKRTSTVPNFVCPTCSNEHKNLTPGPYGILRRFCTCNERMPTTFFNGRSRLKATCPFCTTGLAASDAQQFGIQIIGGVSAGKTSYLVAFWHQYIEKLDIGGRSNYEKFPPEAFDELEQWFQEGKSYSTAETNANMYSIVHKQKEAGRNIQLTLYDISGEAFLKLNDEIQQQQFKYCEGLIFIVDPTSNPNDTSTTFSDFIRNFKALKGKHTTRTSNLPVSVVISKADLYKNEIGFAKSDVCREFLNTKGFAPVINLIEGAFSNAQYFPVSAMGHPADINVSYEPWGVMEPFLWILSNSKAESKLFMEIIS
jgi:GTPase SAR1 family protein